MKNSIRVKLSVLVALIILFVLVIQIVFDAQYAEPYFIKEKSSQMETFYQQIEEALRNQPADIKPLAVAHALKKFVERRRDLNDHVK